MPHSNSDQFVVVFSNDYCTFMFAIDEQASGFRGLNYRLWRTAKFDNQIVDHLDNPNLLG